MEDPLLINALAILGLMTLVWVISLPLRKVDIIDIAWGAGFVMVAWISFALQGESPARWTAPVGILTLLTTIWGLRLATHLARRNLGHAEDKRYAAMRAARPNSFWWKSYFMVFLLQGALLWVVSLPLQLGTRQTAIALNWQHAVGIALWGIGFFFEAVGDWQLTRFKSNLANKGKVMQTGLWRYTRHPNYFGDFCVWCGLFLIATGDGRHWATIISPLIMSFLLLKVSGVTLLERSLQQEKPDYAEYARRTSSFFPWPPAR
ncbi:DUF1295 domain-containing protein [Planctomicrobium piriforme]|uniref:Steroid 5-alpha reductase family enzyme n=1 Tax=Planctomicrobium piriforme TaxID=1576369 RepID=A0A1I3FAT1_9PLAN|nr:DUF1295 domain-containing protein [Planctomicrobium piriforme]SFI08282.1 Steroid 5-alpha reductase family enzyme [Planctomicrobium piriforme]